MPSTYHHRRLSPDDFARALKDSGFSINDFLFVSGRDIRQIGSYMNNDSRVIGRGKRSFTPTMSDVLILELARDRPRIRGLMLDIASKYVIDRPGEEEKSP